MCRMVIIVENRIYLVITVENRIILYCDILVMNCRPMLMTGQQQL